MLRIHVFCYSLSLCPLLKVASPLWRILSCEMTELLPLSYWHVSRQRAMTWPKTVWRAIKKLKKYVTTSSAFSCVCHQISNAVLLRFFFQPGWMAWHHQQSSGLAIPVKYLNSDNFLIDHIINGSSAKCFQVAWRSTDQVDRLSEMGYNNRHVLTAALALLHALVQCWGVDLPKLF